MIIVAKFESRCGACGVRIAPGEKVEWSRGQAATHLSCHARKPRSKPKPAAKPAAAAGTRRVTLRDGKYPTGSTVFLHNPKLEPTSADVAVVVSSRRVPPNEDNGDYEWTVSATVRAATPDEAAHALRVRTERRERVEAEQAAKAQREVMYPAWRDAVVAGLTRVEEGTIDRGVSWIVRDEQVGVLRVSFGEVPGVGYVETSYAMDDYRVCTWVPREEAEARWRRWAEAAKVTPEVAREWLAKYRGCVGTSAYEFIAGTA